MRTFIFWQKWLFYSSLMIALIGIVLAIYGNNPLFSLYSRAVAKVLWNLNEISPSADTLRVFVAGPFGATIACCYILLAFIAWFPFRKRERWARNAIVVAFAIWAVLDSAVISLLLFIVGIKNSINSESKVIIFGSCTSFAIIDVFYFLKGSISAVYLADALLQIIFILAWILILYKITLR